LEAQELASELAGYCQRGGEERDALSGVQAPGDGSLDALEERLTAIERLVRKHGGSLEALLDYARGARERRTELADAELSAERTEEELAVAHAELDEHIRKLRRARRAAAAPLAAAVC